ncbi:putative cytochrome P450 [Rosa chinensis]|uniref:Putative cytochrome P450 n=1 Tax=Rosa chinensis TaxID=74649 RepID=A0A2P6P2E8_ROSCH|nr:putative cytochrome P450 [Rosa chinensis]
MEISLGVWVALVLGGLPFWGLLLWWWNEFWYVLPLKLRGSSTGAKLPPGHLGFPFLGEMLSFLWYFKIVCHPDEFINAKRAKYGDGVGMYRTHMFGKPSIITCLPEINKLVFQSEENFPLNWPNVDILGSCSLVAVHGSSHARLRSYVVNVINKPDALRRIAGLVQPRIVAALESWALKGRIKAYDESKKVTFENIGKLFASLEPGPLLDTIDKLFEGVVKGIRAQPFNVPGSAYHHALQCRRKLEAIFRVELEKKKFRKEAVTTDLMDGLMQITDDEGDKLSDKEVIDNIVSLVIAGYASTALSAMWAIFYLAKYPNVFKKLREENMIVSQNKNGEFITSDDVSKMKYTNKVVEEIIRLANIAAFVFRSVTKEIEYKGYIIPKNWNMLVWVRYLHTNSEHFDDPMCFKPDRWNNPAKPGTYQVFGGGSRICAGNMLVRLQLAIFLHHLSVGYKWKLLNPNACMNYLPHPRPADNVEVTFSKI